MAQQVQHRRRRESTSPGRRLAWLALSLLACGAAGAVEFRMRSPVPTYVEQTTADVGIVSGHFDADGQLDVAMCFARTKVKIFDQAPLGTLVLRREEPLWENLIPPYGGSPYLTDDCHLHVVDLDGNATDDLVVTHSQGTLVLRMLPDGSVARQEYARREGVYQYGDGFRNSLMADMDNDGDLDLVGIRYNGILSRLTNEGDGRLSAPTDVGRVELKTLWEVELAAGDLDGDGLTDLVVASPTLDYIDNGGLTILLYGTRGGQLLERSRILHPPRYAMNVAAVGDVTGDGKDDLLLINPANQPRGVLAVYEQGPDGTLKAPVAYPVYDLAESVRIEDLDGDGRNDLALLHPHFTALTTYLQRGDGLFDFHRLVYNANNQQFGFNTMSIRDFMGDGCKDVLIASEHYLWADGTGCLPASKADVATSVLVNDTSTSMQVENRDSANAAHAVVATLRLDSTGITTAFPAAPDGCTVSAANRKARVYVCRIGRLEPGEIRIYSLAYSHKRLPKGRYSVDAVARVRSHGDDPRLANNVDQRNFWRVMRRPTPQVAPPASQPAALAPARVPRVAPPARALPAPARRPGRSASH